jgi:hypothetical protein
VKRPPSSTDDLRARLRSQPAPVRYDVERGLVRHRRLVQADAPLPGWADELPTQRRAGWLRRVGWIAGVSTVAVVLWLRRAPEPAAPRTSEPVAQQRETRDDSRLARPRARFDHAVPPRERAVSERTPAMPQQPSTQASEAEPQLAVPAGMPPTGGQAPNVLPPGVQVASQARQPAPPVVTTAELRQRTAGARTAPLVSSNKRERGHRSARVEAPQDNLELQQLVEAERALPGAPLRALRLAREGELNFRDGYFAQERRYIEVMALFALGRLGEAHAQAAAFLRDYPRAPYRRKVELEMLRLPQH